MLTCFTKWPIGTPWWRNPFVTATNHPSSKSDLLRRSSLLSLQGKTTRSMCSHLSMEEMALRRVIVDESLFNSLWSFMVTRHTGETVSFLRDYIIWVDSGICTTETSREYFWSAYVCPTARLQINIEGDLLENLRIAHVNGDSDHFFLLLNDVVMDQLCELRISPLFREFIRNAPEPTIRSLRVHDKKRVLTFLTKQNAVHFPLLSKINQVVATKVCFLASDLHAFTCGYTSYPSGQQYEYLIRVYFMGGQSIMALDRVFPLPLVRILINHQDDVLVEFISFTAGWLLEFAGFPQCIPEEEGDRLTSVLNVI